MDRLDVTKVFLPPFEEYCDLLREIWATHIVTNDGPLYQRFEDQLRRHTGISHLACLGNGTLALQLAVHALELNETQIITTPFTHVATSGSLLWERCHPVYVDIDPETLNLDPGQIEAKLTDQTAAIVGVHVYSNPCDVEEIDRVARRHDLRVIYDGAHAFGAEYRGRSILAYGDLSTASFHATKGMHTIEGGAVFSRNPDLIARVRRLAYYGMDENRQIVQKWGTNGKMCEFSAAMGILCLRYAAANVARRKQLHELYISLLEENGSIRFQKLTGQVNYTYMPVVLESEDCKDAVLRELNQHEIYPREYFYPSLETVFSERIDCPVAYDLSHRVLCLPLSGYLEPDDVRRVCKITNRACEMYRRPRVQSQAGDVTC